MPANKDFKRLVRARMTKTGESYTTARLHLLRQRPTRSPSRPASKPPARPADYARLAGMSDAAVKAKTGCNWERWVRSLDHHGAADLSHREIARLISRKYKTPGWWAQMVAVGYERIRGLRERGQRRDGAFEASKTRTLPVAVSRVYRGFTDTSLRRRWLPQPLQVRTATRNKSVRLGWDDGTLVVVSFAPKGTAKSQVAIQHTKLPTREVATRMKAFWSERLGALAALL
jgi:hypothetical protein